MSEKPTPATAAAQLKQELPGWTAAEMTDCVDKPEERYWHFYVSIEGCSMLCQYCENAGYLLEIEDDAGELIVDSEGDHQPSLTEAIAALRQAAAKQMQVLGTLGDTHEK